MIEKDIFFKRLNHLRTVWENEELHVDKNLSRVHCLIAVAGNNDPVSNRTSAAFMIWLFGYAVQDSIIIIEKHVIHILTTQQYLPIFETIKDCQEESTSIQINVIEQASDHKYNFETLTSAIESFNNTLGIFVENSNPTGLIEAWEIFIQNRSNKLDVSSNMAMIMSVKDSSEHTNMKNAGLIAESAMNYIFHALLSITCNNEKKTDHQLSEEIIETLMYRNRHGHGSECSIKKRFYFKDIQETIDTLLQNDQDKNKTRYPIEICYYPIISTGGVYSPEFDAGSDDNMIQIGVITFSVGIKFNHYCCNITRTLMLHPSKNIVANYKMLVKVQDVILKELKAGVALNEVHSIALQFIMEKRPDLLKYFSKRSLGSITGIKFKENSISINAETTLTAQKGMTFNLSIAFMNLLNKETNSRYTLWIADTILVDEHGSVPLTAYTAHWRCRCIQYNCKKTTGQTVPFRTIGNSSNQVE